MTKREAIAGFYENQILLKNKSSNTKTLRKLYLMAISKNKSKQRLKSILFSKVSKIKALSQKKSLVQQYTFAKVIIN